MKNSIVVSCACLLLLPALAMAQALALYVDDGGTLVNQYDLGPAVPFEVVTMIDTEGHDLSVAEWVQSPLSEIAPGVFVLSRVSASCTIDLSIKPPGEYVVPICGGCEPASTAFELARVRYLDASGAVTDDTVLSIRGFEAGDSVPSSFNGDPGIVDCSDALFVAMMRGGDPLITGSGVVVPSGALVLNPTPPIAIPTGADSFTRVKGRYR